MYCGSGSHTNCWGHQKLSLLSSLIMLPGILRNRNKETRNKTILSATLNLSTILSWALIGDLFAESSCSLSAVDI